MPAILTADADALIPVEVMDEIFQELPAQSIAMTHFRHVQLSNKEQRTPVLSVLPSAAFRQGEAQNVLATKMGWKDKFLTAEELVCYVPIPKTVLDDSNFPIWDEVRPRAVEAMGEVIDNAIFFGTGKPASWDNAIVPEAVARGNFYQIGTVPADKLNVDISNTMSLVEEDGFAVNGFAARTGMKGKLRGLVDDNGNPIYSPSVSSEQNSLLYGERIEYAKHDGWDNAQAELVAGDYRKGLIGIRSDVEFDVAKEGVIQDAGGAIEYNLLQMGMRCLIITMRVAFAVADHVTRKNQDEATVYPFAVLQPSA